MGIKRQIRAARADPERKELAGVSARWRLIAVVPQGHWKASTLVAGLRTTGFTAPLVVDGDMNGDIFGAYVEQVLAPIPKPGNVVTLDNLRSHKVVGVHEAIDAR